MYYSSKLRGYSVIQCSVIHVNTVLMCHTIVHNKSCTWWINRINNMVQGYERTTFCLHLYIFGSKSWSIILLSSLCIDVRHMLQRESDDYVNTSAVYACMGVYWGGCSHVPIHPLPPKILYSKLVAVLIPFCVSNLKRSKLESNLLVNMPPDPS